MKTIVLFAFFVLGTFSVQSQSLDSIYFNLYTDSLKKGTYNYINVEGVFKNGRILPLDSTHVKFVASRGHFKGNSLWVEPDTKEEKISITVIQKNDPSRAIYTSIYIKKYEDHSLLKSLDDVNKAPGNSKKKKKQ